MNRTHQQINEALSLKLTHEGEEGGDQEFVRVGRDGELGDIQLTDYWNSMHRAQSDLRIGDYQGRRVPFGVFLEAGHVPILELKVRADNPDNERSLFSYRPVDVIGLGRAVLVEALLEEDQGGEEIVAVDYNRRAEKHLTVLSEPIEDAELLEALAAVLGE